MTKVRTFILRKASSRGYTPALKEALGLVNLFWSAYGYPLEITEPEVYHIEGIDLTSSNPWYDVYNAVQGLYTPPEKVLVILEGWDIVGSLGWGGDPLAVVGEYTVQRFLTIGSPEHIVDDWPAVGILAHELGHVLGFSHDLTKLNNVMWSGLYNFPETYPPQAVIDLALEALRRSNSLTIATETRTDIGSTEYVQDYAEAAPLYSLDQEPCPMPEGD